MSREEWFHMQQSKKDRLLREARELKIEFKAGDLVKIQPWCKTKGRLAHVTEVASYDARQVTIQYIDSEGLREEPSVAVVSNLILIDSEEKE